MNIVKFQTKYDRRCFLSADIVCEWFYNSPVDNMNQKSGHLNSLPNSSGLVWCGNSNGYIRLKSVCQHHRNHDSWQEEVGRKSPEAITFKLPKTFSFCRPILQTTWRCVSLFHIGHLFLPSALFHCLNSDHHTIQPNWNTSIQGIVRSWQHTILFCGMYNTINYEFVFY